MAFVQRLASVPLVSAATSRALPVITRITARSSLVRGTLSLARWSADLLLTPVARLLATPMQVLDRIACLGLDRVEERFPIVWSTPEQAVGTLQDIALPLAMQVDKSASIMLVAIEHVADCCFFPGEDEVDPFFWPNLEVPERIERVSVRMGKRVYRAVYEYLEFLVQLSDAIGGEVLATGLSWFSLGVFVYAPNLMEAHFTQHLRTTYKRMLKIISAVIDEITLDDGELNKEFPEWFVHNVQRLQCSYEIGRDFVFRHTSGLRWCWPFVAAFIIACYRMLFKIPNIRKLKFRIEAMWFYVWRYVIDAWWIFSSFVDYFVGASVYRRKLYIPMLWEVTNGIGPMYGVGANY